MSGARGRASERLVGKTMAEIEREAILTALQVTGGNRRRAAESLGIGLRTLQRKLKEYHGEPVGEDDEDLGDDGTRVPERARLGLPP